MNYDSFMKEAFELADKMQYEEDLATNVKHNFSPEYEKRMKKIRRMYTSSRSTFSKRSLALVACLCCCFFVLFFTASAFGGYFVDWISNITDKGTNIRFDIPEDRDVPYKIEKEYVLHEIPEGFEPEYEDVKTNVIDRIFRDDRERYISFTQYCYRGFSGNFNTESAVTEELSVNGERGFYIESIHSKLIVWENGEYIFVIIVPKEFTKDELLDLACNIVAKE